MYIVLRFRSLRVQRPGPLVISCIWWPDVQCQGRAYAISQGCAQFRVESTLAHSTQFSFELTFELIFECATLWMPIHWAEWGFIGLVRTIPFNSHSRIDSLLSKSSHGWECECVRMAFELDTTLPAEVVGGSNKNTLQSDKVSDPNLYKWIP